MIESGILTQNEVLPLLGNRLEKELPARIEWIIATGSEHIICTQADHNQGESATVKQAAGERGGNHLQYFAPGSQILHGMRYRFEEHSVL